LKEEKTEITRWVYEIAAHDSQAAFKSLYFAYFQRLTRFISLYVSSPWETEEIVSDIFLAIWNNRRSLIELSSFNSYIYTIARNKIVNYYRGRIPETTDLSENTIDLFRYTHTTPEEELITKESICLLNAAINSLPDKCKMTFKLIREDKLKYKEVAAILDISIKTVEAHLATAIRKLREALSTEILK